MDKSFLWKLVGWSSYCLCIIKAVFFFNLDFSIACSSTFGCNPPPPSALYYNVRYLTLKFIAPTQTGDTIYIPFTTQYIFFEEDLIFFGLNILAKIRVSNWVINCSHDILVEFSKSQEFKKMSGNKMHMSQFMPNSKGSLKMLSSSVWHCIVCFK